MGKCIAKIQEYDVEIKPQKMVKGQGIASFLVGSNYRVLELNALSTNIVATESKEDETQEPS
jgi:hypothetical protein